MCQGFKPHTLSIWPSPLAALRATTPADRARGNVQLSTNISQLFAVAGQVDETEAEAEEDAEAEGLRPTLTKSFNLGFSTESPRYSPLAPASPSPSPSCEQ